MTQDSVSQGKNLTPPNNGDSSRPRPRGFLRLFTSRNVIGAIIAAVISVYLVRLVDQFWDLKVPWLSEPPSEMVLAISEVFETVNPKVKEKIRVSQTPPFDSELASILVDPPFNIHAHISFEPSYDRNGDVDGGQWELMNLVIKHRRRDGSFGDFVRMQNQSGKIPGVRTLPDDGNGLGDNEAYRGCKFRIAWDIENKPYPGELSRLNVTIPEEELRRLLVVQVSVLEGKSKNDCGLE